MARSFAFKWLCRLNISIYIISVSRNTVALPIGSKHVYFRHRLFFEFLRSDGMPLNPSAPGSLVGSVEYLQFFDVPEGAISEAAKSLDMGLSVCSSVFLSLASILKQSVS